MVSAGVTALGLWVLGSLLGPVHPFSVPPCPSWRDSGSQQRHQLAGALAVAGAGAGAGAGASGGRSEPEIVTTRDFLSLNSIRGSLGRQEETIIFALLERAAFRVNLPIYTEKKLKLHKEGSDSVFDRDCTFLEHVLCETEKIHARVRRYTSPEEYPFFPGFLPETLLLPPLDYSEILAPNDVNENARLMESYIGKVIPGVCMPGDDEQYGSSVICDVTALQALSRRIHFGKFVAESKFRDDSEKYRLLCKQGDAAGVNELLTNRAVEKRVLDRALRKASTYGQDLTTEEGGEKLDFKVDPHTVVAIYRDLIIPMTKDVEIRYLFQRSGYPCPSLDNIHEEAA